jgi:Domain of unknown function (DUF4345)
MGHKLGTAVLAVAALFCLLTTVSSAVDPETFARRLGLSISDAGGINEIRAQYAGFFLAIAIVCGLSLAAVLRRQLSFVVLSTIFGGLLFGRLVSWMMNGGFGGYSATIRSLYVIDALGLALALTALAYDNPRAH